MNFISLRDQLQNWTLNSDQKLYRAIKQLSDNVLQVQKNIQKNIQNTRYQVLKGCIEVGSGFNHYLRISQNKFTQNKIDQQKQIQKTEPAQSEVQQRSKISLYTQALDIGMKNLQIQQDKNADLVSVSDVSASSQSLSNSIFKEGKLPAIFGTQKFAANPYLQLFSQNQLDASIANQTFQVNQLIVPNQDKDGSSEPFSPSNNILPPPPPLEQVLENPQNIQTPPSNGLLPPPPPPPSKLNSSMPQNSLPPPPPPPPAPPGLSDSFIAPHSDIQKKEQNKQDLERKQNRALTMQQQMALRIKHGKKYNQVIKQQEVVKIQSQRKNQQQGIRKVGRQSMSSENANRIIQQSADMFKNKTYNDVKKGDNFENILKQNSQIQDEQVDSLFGPSKQKGRQNTQAIKNIKLDDQIMKRSTFNQDLLFKKKSPAIQKANQKKKTEKKSLFGDDSEQESEIVIPKKIKSKTATIADIQPKTIDSPIKQKRKLLQSDSQEEDFMVNSSKKKQQINVVFKKKQPAQVIQIHKQEPSKQDINIQTVIYEKQDINLHKGNQLSTIVQRQSMSSSVSSTAYARNVSAAHGGKEMPLIPKGMVITKPSEVKKNEALAIQKLQNQAKDKQKIEQKQTQVYKKQQKLAQQPKQIIQIEKQKQSTVKSPSQVHPVQKPKQKPKKSLFDDQEDQDDFFTKAKVVVPPPPMIKQLQAQDNNTRKTVQHGIDKPQQLPRQSEQTSMASLATRRKKGKGNNLPNKRTNNLFSSDDEQKEKVPIMTSIRQSKDIKQNSVKKNYADPLLGRQSVQSSASAYAQKVAKASGMPGMMGMPLMPKGMALTKPSQTRKNQEQALLKIKQQEQEKQKQIQKQKQLQKQKQEQRKNQKLKIQQQRQKQEILKKKEEQKIRQEAEKIKRQQLQQEQRQRKQQLKRIQQIQKEKMIKEQKQKQKQKIAQLQRKQRQQKQRIQNQKIKIQQLQKQRKQKQAAQIQKPKQAIPFIPKLASKKASSNPISNLPTIPKVSNTSNNPLGTAATKKSNPLGGPLASRQSVKNSQPLSKKPTKNLFGDDNEEDMNFRSSKTTNKPVTKPLTKKKNLFDDDQEQGDFLTSKPQTQSKINQVNPQPSKVELKPSNKTDLFKDNDEDIGFLPKKENNISNQNTLNISTNLPKKKKNLFSDDDEDDTLSFKNSSKNTLPNKPQPKVKKDLFGDDEDDDDFMKPKNVTKPSPLPNRNTKNLFGDSDSDQSVGTRQKIKDAKKKIKQFN